MSQKKGKIARAKGLSWDVDRRANNAARAFQRSEAFNNACREVSEAVRSNGPWATAVRLSKPFTA